ncbi:MAG: carbohydrate kinase family protein [Nocardioides sp.]
MTSGTQRRGPVVVVGGANMDVLARTSAILAGETSNPGRTLFTPGGVGRNLAENLARWSVPVRLVSKVGDDSLGRELLTRTAAAGVDVSLVTRLPGAATGTYVAVIAHTGDLVVAISDMSITEAITPADIERLADALADAQLVMVDANLLPAALGRLLDVCAEASVPVIVEPVSVPKAARLSGVLWPGRPIHTLTPNLAELQAMTGVADPSTAAQLLRERGVQRVWCHRTAGSTLYNAYGAQTVRVDTTEAMDVTGAGDALVAAYAAALLRRVSIVEAVRFGHRAAALTVQSDQTVRSDLASLCPLPDDPIAAH